MKTNLIISDGDISLRTLIIDDIEMLRNWRNQESIRYSFIFNEKITRLQQEQWFIRYNSDENDYMFIALYKGVPIGASALYNINKKENSAEFGRLMLGDVSQRGLGLGKRITRLTTRMGFETFKLHRIYLEVFEENTYALKIYKELGYKVTGNSEKNGKIVSLMEILAKDFKL